MSPKKGAHAAKNELKEVPPLVENHRPTARRRLDADALERRRALRPFAFEKPPKETRNAGASRRSAESANGEYETLVHRLCLTGETEKQLRSAIADDPELQRLLLRWANDLPVNIAWYQNGLRRKRSWQRVSVAFVLVLTTVAIAAVTYLALTKTGTAGTVSAQITFVVSALFIGLQVVARATDLKAQIAAFWEASANMKEAVYRLEEDWTDHAWDAPELIRFKAALKENLRLARDEMRKERAAFFRTLQSPAEILESASGAVAALQGKKDAFQKAQEAALSAQRAEIAAHEAAASPETRQALKLRVDMEVLARDLEAARNRLLELQWVHEAEVNRKDSHPEVTDEMLAAARTKVAKAEAAFADGRDELRRHLERTV